MNTQTVDAIDMAEVIADLIDDEDVTVFGARYKIIASHDADVWGKRCLELASFEEDGGVTEFSVTVRKTRVTK